MKRCLMALALLALATAAARADGPRLCVEAAMPRAQIAAHDGAWIALTPEQWQFLRGIYAMNPTTPPGLPFGDRAALATVPGEQGGLVFFLDGDLACTPMPAPSELVDLLHAVGEGTIAHAPGGT